MNFARKIADSGVKYVWWLGEEILGHDIGPFYAVNAPPPSFETMKVQGICCTGVLNVVRRQLGLPIPGVLEGHPMAGGTGCWEGFLAPHWKPFEPEKSYPEGTLLFRPYHDFNDQGHVAIVLSDGRLLHSYVDDPTPKPGMCTPGCVVDASWKTSHGWKSNGYYMFIAPPEAWLTKA